MVGRGAHIVQLYERDLDLAASVADFVGEALREQEPVFVAITDHHWDVVRRELERQGTDPEAAEHQGRLTVLDPASIIEQFLIDGKLCGEAFRRSIGATLCGAEGPTCPVRAVCETFAVLWDAGQVGAALELEHQWNILAGELPFSLLCAVPASTLEHPDLAPLAEQICTMHDSQLPSTREGSPESPELAPDSRPSGSAGGHCSTRTEMSGSTVSPRAARQFLVSALDRWGYEGRLVSDAELVLSELATNAVLHAKTGFEVSLTMDEGLLRLAVHDDSSLPPEVQDDDPDAETGRGLQLVSALCERWGVDVAPGRIGKTVWAEVTAAYEE